MSSVVGRRLCGNRQPAAAGLRCALSGEASVCHDGRMKVRELIKLVESDGWKQVRMRGSHRQFRHPRKKGTVTIAGKPSVDVPPGTANNVLKQAGLKQ